MSKYEYKLTAINRLLNEEYFFCHINPKISGTLLPPHLMTQATVTLKLSSHFQGKFAIDEACINAELSFNKQYFACTIPLAAIWGITSIKGTNLVWNESMPNGVAAALRPDDKPATSSAPAVTEAGQAPRKGGHLKRVK